MAESNNVSTKALLLTFALVIFLLFIFPILITSLIGYPPNSQKSESGKELYLTDKTIVDEKGRNNEKQTIIVGIVNNGDAKKNVSVQVEAYKKNGEWITSEIVIIEKIEKGEYEDKIEIDIKNNRDVYYIITLFYDGEKVDSKTIS